MQTTMGTVRRGRSYLGPARTLLAGAFLACGCATEVDLGNHPADGSGAGTGDETSAGGSTSTGGSSTTGGSTSTGGSSTTGGSTSTGGSSTTGGSTSTGGSSTTGGSTGTGGSSTTGGTASGGSAGAVEPPVCTDLIGRDAHDYKLTSSLTGLVTEVLPKVELSFDWYRLVRDMTGTIFDSATIDHLEIASWNLAPDAFAQSYIDNSLDQRDLTLLLQLPVTNGRTSESLFEAQVNAMPVDAATLLGYFDPAKYPPSHTTYAAYVDTGPGLFEQTRMIQLFQLDESSDNTAVSIASDSSTFVLATDFDSLVPHVAAPGEPHLRLDWSRVSSTATGAPFVPQSIDRLEILEFAGSLDAIADKKLLQRTDLAEQVWTADLLVGSSFDLAGAKDAQEHGFPGIDANHTWVVALDCTTCTNPAPPYLSVLRAATPGDSCDSRCGDGIVQTELGEQCDDGIDAGDYGGCSPTCLVGPHCGDGIVQLDAGEACDDGPANGVTDPCSSDCRVNL